MENLFETLGGRKATFFLAVVVLLIVIEVLKRYTALDFSELRPYLLGALGIYTGGNAVSKVITK